MKQTKSTDQRQVVRLRFSEAYPGINDDTVLRDASLLGSHNARGQMIKHIQQDIIDSTLENIDETKLAYKAAQKQARKTKTTEWKIFRKKMFGHLARRGFNYATCAQVVEQIWAEQINTNQEKSERIY